MNVFAVLSYIELRDVKGPTMSLCMSMYCGWIKIDNDPRGAVYGQDVCLYWCLFLWCWLCTFARHTHSGPICS